MSKIALVRVDYLAYLVEEPKILTDMPEYLAH